VLSWRCVMSILLHGRAARPAPVAWNVLKTLLGAVLLWGVFFVALPYLCSLVDPFRFDGVGWQVAGILLFVLGRVLPMTANLALALYGEGTPLFLDGPRRLVIAGPYRYVRNPMAIAMLAQAVGAALWLGSPLALLYALLLVAADNFGARRVEDRDLKRRLGASYRLYRRRVWCWRPRLRGYDPAHEADEPVLAAER